MSCIYLALFFVSILDHFLMGQEVKNQFKLFKFDNFSGYYTTDLFKTSYLITSTNGVNLIQCAAFCTQEENCLSFAFIKQPKTCEIYSFKNFSQNNIIKKISSKIYTKSNFEIVSFTRQVSQETSLLASTSTATTQIITTISSDFKCINQVCTCNDNTSFYSTIQNKCIKCRSGWLPYKNICYQAFSTLRKWQDYVNFCSSLNSTLLIAEEQDKFEFFRPISKSLFTINSNQRTWVNAVYNVINVFEWINLKPINTSYFVVGIWTNYLGCFSYYTTPNSLLGIYACTLSSNGICEYTE